MYKNEPSNIGKLLSNSVTARDSSDALFRLILVLQLLLFLARLVQYRKYILRWQLIISFYLINFIFNYWFILLIKLIGPRLSRFTTINRIGAGIFPPTTTPTETQSWEYFMLHSPFGLQMSRIKVIAPTSPTNDNNQLSSNCCSQQQRRRLLLRECSTWSDFLSIEVWVMTLHLNNLS